MNETRVIKRLLAIEELLKAMNPDSAEDLIKENKELKAQVLEMRKENGILKGKLTKVNKKILLNEEE